MVIALCTRLLRSVGGKFVWSAVWDHSTKNEVWNSGTEYWRTSHAFFRVLTDFFIKIPGLFKDFFQKFQDYWTWVSGKNYKMRGHNHNFKVLKKYLAEFDTFYIHVSIAKKPCYFCASSNTNMMKLSKARQGKFWKSGVISRF